MAKASAGRSTISARKAIRQLKELGTAISTKLIKRSRTKRASPNRFPDKFPVQFSVAELSSLQKNIWYQLGRRVSANLQFEEEWWNTLPQENANRLTNTMRK